MAADGSIIIDTRINTDGVKAGTKDLEAAARRTASNLQGVSRKAQISVNKAVTAIAKQNQAYAQQERKVASLQKQLDELGEQKVETDAYKEILAEIERIDAQLGAASEKKRQFLESGGDRNSNRFKKMSADVKRLQEDFKAARIERDRLEASGGAYQSVDTGALSRQLEDERAKLSNMGGSLQNALDSLDERVNSFNTSANKALGIKDRLINGFKHLGKSLLGMNRSASGTQLTFGKMLRTSLLMGAAFRALSAVTGGMGTGLTNLARYSSSTNASISSLQSALTRLQNSLATAFSPILSVVAPVLTTLMNLLSQATTYIGMFFAALTGQKTFTRAKAVQQDYAASLDGTASSAGNAADATRDAADATQEASEANDDYLSGLDEITRWESPDSGSDTGASGGGGSGGGGGGGAGSDDLFETVEMPDYMEDLAAMIKEAWEKADFTEIGQIVGEKLRDALNNIPWDEVKAAAEKIAKSTATFLNGFFETPGLWEAVGNTVGEGVNTALTALNTFEEYIHTDAIGSAITTSLQTAFNSIDWSLVTSTLTNGVARGLDFVTGLIDGIDWRTLPTDLTNAVKEAFEGIQWAEVAESFGTLLGTALRAVGNLTLGIDELVSNIVSSIIDYFSQYISEADTGFIGTDFIAGIFNGMVDFLKDVGTWIKENVLQPAIDGFKSAFDIHSPSQHPDILEIGKNIMLGILNGIIEGLSDIGNWVKDNVLTPIINAVQDAGGIVVGVAAKAVEWAKDGWDALASKTKDIAAKATAWAKDGWESLSAKTRNIYAKATAWAKDGWASLSAKTRNIYAKATAWAKGGWASLSAKTRNIYAKATAWASKWNSLPSKVVNLKANITSFVGNVGALLRRWLGLATGGIYKNGHWQPIQGYASGGSPQTARLFYANENGMPELVGRIGSSTAVMNNGQIVASVAAGVYQAVLAAFGRMSNYFAAMSINLANIPSAIESLAGYFPKINTAMPVMATGTIIPPQAVLDSGDVQSLKSAVEELKNALSGTMGGMNSARAANKSNSWHFTAQINRRTLFEEFMDEARLRQMTTGRNPFDLK